VACSRVNFTFYLLIYIYIYIYINAQKEYLEKACREVMEFIRTGSYDLMYMKTKELGRKETQEIQNISIEDSHGNRIVDQRQVLKICERYVTELYDRPN
jgi:hypothetical protein